MKTRSANGKLKAGMYVEDDVKEVGEDDSGDVASEDSDVSDDEPPSLKRRRQSHSNAKSFKSAEASTSKAKGKGKIYRGRNVGKLSRLLEMPVDIFCEITVYLEPLDLLRLARSTKGFNQMLMSRNSKPIWRSARNYYADLPDCPSDLSEPEYARLLFERDCHACLAPRVLKVDYVLRARLCHRCRSSYILKGTQLIKTIPGVTEGLLECIPCRNMEYSGRRHRRLEYFYSCQVEALVTKYRATVPHDLSNEHTRALQKEFFDHNKAVVAEIVQHAADIDKWLRSDAIARGEEAVEATHRRRADIIAKLIEMGYSESDLPSSAEDYQWDQIMDQPRDLTPRIWTKVRPKLEEVIQRMKMRREECARSVRQSRRYSEIRALLDPVLAERKKRNMELFMAFDDALKLPSIDALVKDDDWHQQVTQAKWDPVWPQIEQEMDEYAAQIRRDLMGLVLLAGQVPGLSTHDASSLSWNPDASPSSQPPAVDAGGIDVAFLSSASTFFECNHCLGLFQYPAILNHSHRGWWSRWRLKDFKFSVATSFADSLLASLAPREREMNVGTLGSALQCLRCDEHVSRLMNWSDLVMHYVQEHQWFEEESQRQELSSVKITLHNDHVLDTQSPMFTVLSPNAARVQQEKIDAWTVGESWKWRCGLCHKIPRSQTRKWVALHLSMKHLKNLPEEGDIVEHIALCI